MITSTDSKSNKNIVLLIIVASLGYFVDMYDLVLFSVIRVASLKGIGVADEDLLSVGVSLINAQMIGMLVGGLLWGIWGDKKGRLQVLFGSILMYSAANIANGFVTDVFTYGLIRFIAGVGLAGELGAGITLVTESMSKEKRGYGTMLVASIGLLGAVTAGLIGDKFAWQTAYFIGGGMGIILLILRIGVFESGMFHKIQDKNIRKGDFMMILGNWGRLKKYLNCTLIALPTWFVVGILVTFAPEFGDALGATEPLSAGKGIMFTYLGISIGDMISGLLSQYFKTRKKVVAGFLVATLISVLIYLFSSEMTTERFYFICVLLGLSTGFWVIFVTIAAEQFGTNLRATVTTTVPNFIRGSLVLVTLSFEWLKTPLGIINAALLVGATCITIAFISVYNLEETYGKDLDYIEE
ncbi:major facilitator superfamily MFS_1 [Pseudopedobacter saltans DSM 12145]|uniref:Major facilitator superfamily MFS_1 n=1 Tax=Pseudopedobacter saltans (strain ATCC 51119 / DSM 12145 / JCM 21818 / CCUG 39354 / LMG 10337 / NBRC 100064 / NCIMB 13643) TaxID=762903 RepID=F0SDR0_PSESL|nr:MFS transporter [Pseudopedobacter saltans]ADY50787.1 major facilitator superfamily MFS_1 [Pseudopedobacter saltans DSM 12145]